MLKHCLSLSLGFGSTVAVHRIIGFSDNLLDASLNAKSPNDNF
jgi:hypothetical protein